MMKLKKLISMVAGISMLACSLVSCSGVGGGGDTPDGKPKDMKDDVTQDALDLNAKSPSSSWAFVTYGLDKYAGEDVKITLSCNVEADSNEAETIHFMWQVNQGSAYPEIVGFDVAPGKSTIPVSGSNEELITLKKGDVLYLSTNNATYDLTMKITDLKYTVEYTTTSGGGDDDTPPVEYPTDIFTIGEAGTCGIQIGDGALVPFTAALQFDAPNASDIKYNADGSVTYIAKAAGGAGGSVSFYFDADKTQINSGNYESVDVEFVASPITGKWANVNCNPSVALRLLPYDSTGVFGGFEDVEYFGLSEPYGTCKYTVKIPETFAANLIDSSLFDCIKAFTLKFNDYNQGLNDGDSMMIQIKKIKFNKKAGAAADVPYTPLPAAEKGTVKSINYPTKDYAAIAEGKEPTTYDKHAWVYLPAGYDANDKETKYPVFILLHGFYQNEDTWGLNDKEDGKIKTYMDYFMKDGNYEKFILVCATGVASANWGPNGSGSDTNGYNAFGGELRNDLLPYIYANFNCLEGRENTALAGLSMGGGQTMSIGIGECLDLISYFGAFSAATFVDVKDFMKDVDKNFDASVKINQLYMICGTADTLVIDGFNSFVPEMKKWGRVTKFDSETYEGGTHDFPVWYRGFKHFAGMVFKK